MRTERCQATPHCGRPWAERRRCESGTAGLGGAGRGEGAGSAGRRRSRPEAPCPPRMELLRRAARRPGARGRRWALGLGLAALGLAGLLGSGAHEELLSRCLLPLLLPPPEHAPAAPPPPPGAFELEPAPCAAAEAEAPLLLVLVASAPGHAARRAAVRETWGGAQAGARTVFVLGLPRRGALQAALRAEAARHGDLLQGRFRDSYANLTLKTLALLGWARSRCAAARFLAKADDDVFLNLPGLLAALPAPAPRAYLGRVHWRARPDRDPRSRQHVPAALYAPAAFPPYCSGTAYVLSAPAAGAVLAVARRLPGPPLPLEDVFVGLCARRAGIAPRHLPGLAGAARCPPDPCCFRRALLSVHGVAPARDMRRVWAGPAPACAPLPAWLGRLRCRALAWLAGL
ncbi:LOW QUALITY PROTEIN: beta-1,3-galactosyltransferase 4 [Tiliqua scincoides]|uniref:LOW QUALITY PROTEIN: beta-1,3-galactosyltransferase 4 n=1 Tax=Tiliqua scincoides TaxID=71010 RepID=UPI003462FE21